MLVIPFPPPRCPLCPTGCCRITCFVTPDVLRLDTAEHMHKHKSIPWQFPQTPLLNRDSNTFSKSYLKCPTWIDRTKKQSLGVLNLGHCVLRFALTPSTSASWPSALFPIAGLRLMKYCGKALFISSRPNGKEEPP